MADKQKLVESAPLPLTAEQMQAIGRVAAQWSFAQNVLEHLIWALIPIDTEAGRGITTHIQDTSRLDIIRALAALKHPGIYGEIDGLLGRFNDLRNKRNTIVHSSWAGNPGETATGLKFSARGGKIQPNRSTWKADDIQAVGNEIERWIVDTVNFIATNIGWSALATPPSAPPR